MTGSASCTRPCARPRWATPASPGRPNLARGVAATARVLGWELMPWQHGVNAVSTELDDSGAFAYRQVVVEVPRQQGKSVDVLSLMVSRALRKPGTMINYTAQTRLDARHRLLDVWWPRLAASPLGPQVDVRKG